MSIRVQSIRIKKRWVGLVLLAILIVVGGNMYGRRATKHPDASAMLIAAPIQPEIQGNVTFKNVPGGTRVTAEVEGLPDYKPGTMPIGPHGFHIHENSSCEIGDPANPFQDAGGHWNPATQPHGNHAGDFPVIFSNEGTARMTFFTDKFSVDDVVGRVVIVHLNPDDYRSQPAGDSGLRVACGVIVRYAG